MEDGGLKNWFRTEYGKLKALTWKQRIGYVWDYYKPGMVAIIIIIVLINIGVTMYRNINTDTILSVYFINALYDMDTDSELAIEYTEYIGGLDNHQDFVLDSTVALDSADSQTSYTNQVKFTTLAAAGSIDVCFMDPETFENYLDMDFYGDLRTVLSDEEMEKWSDLMVYKTDEDGEEFPCAIDFSSSPILDKRGMYPDGVYGGISANSKNTEYCSSFFEWLFS